MAIASLGDGGGQSKAANGAVLFQTDWCRRLATASAIVACVEAVHGVLAWHALHDSWQAWIAAEKITVESYAVQIDSVRALAQKLDAVSVPVSAINRISGVVQLIAWVTLAIWSYRIVRQLTAAGRWNSSISPALALAGWFVPLAFFVIPQGVVKGVVNAANAYRPNDGKNISLKLVNAWWLTLWIGTLVTAEAWWLRAHVTGEFPQGAASDNLTEYLSRIEDVNARIFMGALLLACGWAAFAVLSSRLAAVAGDSVAHGPLPNEVIGS